MLAAELVALVVPPRCAACRTLGRRTGDVLCAACRRALPWLARTPCCGRCALPLPHHGSCPARDAPFDAAWSAVAYEGVARDAMHALKFSAARPLAEVMAAQMAATAPPELLPPAPPQVAAGASRFAGPPAGGWASAFVEPPAGGWARAFVEPPAGGWARAFVEPPAGEIALVAVPAHPVRRRTRGFDPAELLARALARRTGLPLADALRRKAGAARQLGADRQTRTTPSRLRFEARGHAPRTAILVDDVHTTGATLGACATALKQAGAQRVTALTWARTL